MQSELWKQVEDLFHHARAMAPDKRVEFLESACGGDLLLQREVETLLDHFDAASSFLETSPVAKIGSLSARPQALTAGKVVGSFEVVHLIGRGGMGEVYRATDKRLKRDVALKVLPTCLSTDARALCRFELEAQAAGRLNHSNIVAIYDIGVHEGAPYLVSELLEGESLRSRLAKGRLPLKTAIDYASQIAAGLAAAHRVGITHRDIKPENLFITQDGRVKILDFGLATCVETRPDTLAERVSTPSIQTAPGRVLGTPPYMSPEQIRGEPTDHRSDVFSFGCVLYEMVTGQPAFQGKSSISIASAILQAEPKAIRGLAPATPRLVAEIVERCLSKDVDRRYQSVDELGVLLDKIAHRRSLARRLPRRRRPLIVTSLAVCGLVVALVAAVYPWPRRPSSRHKIESLAVLPLNNLSGDSQQEYFSEGMTDELITDLAKTTKLRVISHTSVERYRGAKTPLPEIARELGVDAVVEGTVLLSGDRVRITAKLIDGQSDRRLWAESYERDLRDVVGLQNELTRQIATEIGIGVTSRESPGVARPKRAVDPVAYEAYLKGSSYFDRLECRSFENALAYFQKAIDKDPNFAPAYSGLADAYFTLGDWRCFHEEHFDQAEIAANKAIELDPGNAHAHAVLAEIGFSRDWNWIGPAKQFSTAIDLDPNYAIAHSYFGMFLVAMGKKHEGLAEERKAQDIDPFSDRTNQLYTWTLYLAGQFDEAIDQAKHALSISTSYGEYYWLGQCYEKKGMPDQAMKFYLKAMSGVPEEVSLRRTAYDKGGLAGYWREDEQIRRRNNQKVDAVRQAMYYCHRGEKEKAIAQLQLAYAQHVNGLQFLRAEPVYDGLRGDPRFRKLLARLGL